MNNDKHEHHDHCDGCCECGHEHHHEEIDKKSIILLIIGAVLLAVSFIPIEAIQNFPRDVMRIACIVICGLPIFKAAVKNIKSLEIDEKVLLVIAVAAACLIREFAEAAAVTLFFRIGEYMEDYAGRRSRKSIESLFSIVSDEGHLVRPEGGFEEIDADDIKAGMKLAVLPHETVPVDGTVISGTGTVDASALTGESLPVEVFPGSSIMSGMKNGNSTVIYEAAREKNESGAARIIALVEEAAERKGKSQHLAAKFAKYYTPAVIAAAIIVAIVPSIITREWAEWIYRALVLLVASCPCAIVLSIPLAFLSSMGACAKNGMIIKGSNFIEALAAADTAVFDKTGTLTLEVPSVGRIVAGEGFDENEILELAAKCENYSSHPLARSVIDAYGEPDMNDTKDFKEISGGGTSIETSRGRVYCGGVRLMNSLNLDTSKYGDFPVYVALDGRVIGAIDIVNNVRPAAPKAIEDLRSQGINRIAVFTGDTGARAEQICVQVGITDIRADLLPEDKLTALEELKSGSKGVIYVGDGINDAPVLAQADVGIAMGLGTKAAAEAADVILTDSDLTRLGDTVACSRRTMSVMKMNIIFALAVKIAVIVLGIAGVAPMWLAVIADVGTMIVCVLNSARLLRPLRRKA
ncbi:MAG: heavy metal translocating P-type ATPase [Clostridia bacterium]|nr:heavy metal translocating P-type ATPase [Clostridia bacterium]